jgi:dUTP pyrophosphatase
MTMMTTRRLRMMEPLSEYSPLTIKWKKLKPQGKLDMPAKPGDAGYDVYATENAIIPPGCRIQMPLGIALEMPSGMVGLVQGKSGRAVREGLTTIGNVIDSGYRGEVHAVLVNTNHGSFGKDIMINSGEKVAQILFIKNYAPPIREVTELTQSERGADGFGSTGLIKEAGK